jgi:NAD(P)-dependent dehydrogenase (short-subunit alcohol dehydrogenase family)
MSNAGKRVVNAEGASGIDPATVELLRAQGAQVDDADPRDSGDNNPSSVTTAVAVADAGSFEAMTAQQSRRWAGSTQW